MDLRDDDSNLLTLALVLSRLANTRDKRYARLLDRFLEKRLPRLRNIQTGEMDLDILLEDLVRGGDLEYLLSRDKFGRELYSRSDLRDEVEVQELVESAIQRFRKYLEGSVSHRLDSVDSQLALIQQSQARLDSDRNEQLETSKAEIQSYLWLLSTGADISSIEMKRYVPVRIYVSDPVPSDRELYELMIAIDEVSELIGFEKTAEFPSEQGSWWKQIFYKTQDAVSQEGVQKRLTKVELAVKANYLDRPQAQANAHQAEAVSSLINALKEVPNACIQVGSLLVVKTTGDDSKSIVLARTLTAEELKRLEENQSMLRRPDRILEWLNHKNNGAAEVKLDSDV